MAAAPSQNSNLLSLPFRKAVLFIEDGAVRFIVADPAAVSVLARIVGDGLEQWVNGAARYAPNAKVIADRRRRGWTEEQARTKPMIAGGESTLYEGQPLSYWLSRATNGISREALRQRLRKGMPAQHAITLPLQAHNAHSKAAS